MLRHFSLVSFLSKSPSPSLLPHPLSKLLSPKCSIKPHNRPFTKTKTTHQNSLLCEQLQQKSTTSSKSPNISGQVRTQETQETPVSSSSSSSSSSSPTLSNKSKNKARRESPEGLLRYHLDMCSKDGNLSEALRLYDEAREKQVPLSQHHYNVLLYLCSSVSSSHNDICIKNLNLGLDRGFEIFRQMGIDQIQPNEATFTSLARLAVGKEDPELAFDVIKKMADHKIPPRLRSYGPALFGFCKKGDCERAYDVEAHMAASGVSPEEEELCALIEVSCDNARGDKVYHYLHQLRATVRQVANSTAEVLEKWFKSQAAGKEGKEKWDQEKVKEGVVKGGGGWHGIGWLGKGEWKVARSEMDQDGVCSVCREKLVCIDIDPAETANFASSLARLACQKEVRADFTRFQEWLVHHGPFEAVIDGANMGLYNQYNFSFSQLNSVVKAIRQVSPSKKLPLVVLHSRRLKGGPDENQYGKKLLESWRRAGALYATPPGSNDDWYWLYAAVSCKCLLVSNDEMRDHLFQLLGTSFFPRWKEKHQVRIIVSEGIPTFHMPPPYSIVIQESEQGSWHIPTVIGDDIEMPRQWVCATRAASLPHNITPRKIGRR